MKDLQKLIRLSRPFSYEMYFQNQMINKDAEARRLLLNGQIERLLDAGWLGDSKNILSFHLLDWDLRKPEAQRFNKYIPLRVWDKGVLAWYSILGLIISAAPQKMQYTLTQYVFEQMPRRDAVEIGVTSKDDIMFSIEQKAFECGSVIDPLSDLEENTFADKYNEQTLINIRISLPRVHKLLGELKEIRKRIQVIASKKMAEVAIEWSGTLEEAQAFMLKDMISDACVSDDMRRIADVFSNLSDIPLEGVEFTNNALPLLGNVRTHVTIDQKNHRPVRSFLASLVLLTYFAPPNLSWRKIALIPGISCIENNRPLSSEGFFIVLRRSLSKPIWAKWLLLANLWAREKAVFDFSSRAVEKLHTSQALSNAHDIRSLLQNAVIAPLNNAIKDSEVRSTELRQLVQESINCVECYKGRLSLLLDGCADLLKPEGQISGYSISNSLYDELICKDEFNIKAYGDIPEIFVDSEKDLSIRLTMPERSFKSLLHLLITNTIDAIRDRGLPVKDQQIRIGFSKVDGKKCYCKLNLWNSGTKFMQPVFDSAGKRYYTTKVGKDRSGLGLHIIETILYFAGAVEMGDNRHIMLENTQSPDGANISMLLPMRG